MIIDCISDLHGHYPELEGGDLLLLAGDYCHDNRLESWGKFFEWIKRQNYRKKVMIAGNHDDFLWNAYPKTKEEADLYADGVRYWEEEVSDQSNVVYLCDSGIEFEGLKIWGSPWIAHFEGMNSLVSYFTLKDDKELKKKWELIPKDTNILLTHCPPLGFMDWFHDLFTGKIEYCGSFWLYEYIYSAKIRPKLHVFGHIHEGYGEITNIKDLPGVTMVNASHMNKSYYPVNKPIRIEL